MDEFSTFEGLEVFGLSFFKEAVKMLFQKKYFVYICITNAKVAQLVERQPSKLNVASSTLVFRSKASQIVRLFYFKALKSVSVSTS